MKKKTKSEKQKKFSMKIKSGLIAGPSSESGDQIGDPTDAPQKIIYA